MPLQNKVPELASFARFRDLIEAFEMFDVDVNEVLNLIEPALKSLIREKRMPKKVVKIDLPEDRTAMLTRWSEVNKQLTALKSEEQQLRMKIVADNFTGAKLEGSETIDIGWGWRLKATKNQNYTATNESQQTEQLLNAVGQIDPAIAAGLVRWKPELSTKVYRELLTLLETHQELAALMSAAITVKPGMPELELIAPKESVVLESGISQ